jgi:hypothetical protein
LVPYPKVLRSTIGGPVTEAASEALPSIAFVHGEVLRRLVTARPRIRAGFAFVPCIRCLSAIDLSVTPLNVHLCAPCAQRVVTGSWS